MAWALNHCTFCLLKVPSSINYEDLEKISPREVLHLEGRQEDSEVKGTGEILMCESLKAEMALEGGEIPSRLKRYDEHSQREGVMILR